MATSVITIRETTGRRRQLDLVGGGLPFVGAKWAGALKLETNFNPGNPNGVQHVLGPVEMPSAWQGVWRTTQLSSTPAQFSEGGAAAQPVTLAASLRATFEDMVRAGQLLVVSWISDDDERITRFGRVTEYSFAYRGKHDIEWEASFEWTSRGGAVRRPGVDDSILAAARAAAQRATNAAGYAEAQSIISANQASPRSADRFTLGQLEALARAPQQELAQFSRFAQGVALRIGQFADVLVAAKEQPFAVAGQVVDTATAAVQQANQFIDKLGRKGPEQLSLDASVRSLLQAARFYDGAQVQAETMAAENARLARVAAKKRPSHQAGGSGVAIGAGDIVAMHLPKQGETMLSISMRYYGDDFSFELARANGLPGQTIVPPRGPALVIPQRAILDQFRRT